MAVSFLIDMLGDVSIAKIHCETHDDIVIVRVVDPFVFAEFVQVKGAELDKLWSVADVCKRDNGQGSSIFERSLGRDQHDELARFRIVTLRPVVDDLKLLTFPREGTGREPCGPRFLKLNSELVERFPAARSVKGNGSCYWLKHCYWDVRHSEEALARSNLVCLLRYGSSSGTVLLVEQAEVLLDELRRWAKTAGEALWEPDRFVKFITRAELLDWWERRSTEITQGVSLASGGKLAAKMSTASLTDEQVRMAVELRRDYGRIVRMSHYMEGDRARQLQGRVKSELSSLRARYVAGEIALNSASFHVLCLERMEAINADRPAGMEDQSAFLKGCMYDITDRCLHQFARPTP